ncbi:hypothetical protein ASF27_20980 [Methylobacterium sp. Leaf102]|nr:hypothetical protein ASF27_20980 [Methylobacterium sp. Leaf102]
MISGDLTAYGNPYQFDLAADFLGSEKPTRFGFGLGLVQWAESSVSGNHDQWPGSTMIVGAPTTKLGEVLPGPYPMIGQLQPLSATASLRFLFVDSDADVGHVLPNRFLARGCFASQLSKLASQVPARVTGEVRVLVVHHAVSSLGTPWTDQASEFPKGSPSRRTPLEIDGGTLRALQHFLVNAGVQVVLTGHLHVPRLSEFVASNDVETLNVLETRCGTTTQWDHYPMNVLAEVDPERRLPPNSLVCHELVQRSDELVWRASIYWRSRASGFVHRPNRVSLDLPPSLSRELRISA